MILASKILLILEGLILGYLSLLGMFLVLGGSIPFLSGSITIANFANLTSSLMVLVFLVAGWRIYFWVLLGNINSRNHINKLWLVLSVVAVCVIALSCIMHKLSAPNVTNIWYMLSQPFIFGLLFLPTATHLILHIYLEKKFTNK